MIQKILLTLALTLSFGLGTAPRSQASAIAFFPPGIHTVVGSTVFSILVLGLIVGVREQGQKVSGFLKGNVWAYVALGLIMDATSNTFYFQSLNSEDVQKLGLTEGELEAYDSERNRINVLYEESMFALSQTHVENQEAMAKAFHDDIKAEISPEAMSAIQKFFTASMALQ